MLFFVELVVNMLIVFGFIFDGMIIIIISFLVIVKCFVVKVVKWCIDFNIGVSRNIVIQYVNVIDCVLIVVNYYCYVVVFYYFKKVYYVVVCGFYFVVQVIIVIKCIGNGLFLQWCGCC